MRERVRDVRRGLRALAVAALCTGALASCFFGDPSDSLLFTVENRTTQTLVVWELGELEVRTVAPEEAASAALGTSTRDDCTGGVSARTLDDRLEARAPEICHGDTWVIEPDDLRPTRPEE